MRRRGIGHLLSGMKGWVPREKAGGRGPASRRDVGKAERRILTRETIGGVEVSYHATKGMRVTRVEYP